MNRAIVGLIVLTGTCWNTLAFSQCGDCRHGSLWTRHRATTTNNKNKDIKKKKSNGVSTWSLPVTRLMSQSQQDQYNYYNPQQPVKQQPSSSSSRSLFPVIQRIAGVNWTGSYRYIRYGSSDEDPSSVKLNLTGGMRYDITGSIVTLSSFLMFPDGNARQFIMQGIRDDLSSSSTKNDNSDGSSSGLSPPIKLSSAEEDKEGGGGGDGGPTGICMLLTELAPDTILFKEVEEATGRTLLAGSLSIAEGPNGELSLVQISEEVGHGENQPTIKGHQVWRLQGEETTEPPLSDA
jgi:hypothetical protein